MKGQVDLRMTTMIGTRRLAELSMSELVSEIEARRREAGPPLLEQAKDGTLTAVEPPAEAETEPPGDG